MFRYEMGKPASRIWSTKRSIIATASRKTPTSVLVEPRRLCTPMSSTASLFSRAHSRNQSRWVLRIPNVLPAMPVDTYGCTLASTSGLMRSSVRARHPTDLAVAARWTASNLLSTLISDPSRTAFFQLRRGLAVPVEDAFGRVEAGQHSQVELRSAHQHRPSAELASPFGDVQVRIRLIACLAMEGMPRSASS